MNANFVFPRPQPGVARPRPARAAKWSSPSPPSNLASSRDSNALRASILDTALELGVGSNPLVTDWMFNNPLMEEPEDAVSPFFIFHKSFIFVETILGHRKRGLVARSTHDGTIVLLNRRGREARRSHFSSLVSTYSPRDEPE